MSPDEERRSSRVPPDHRGVRRAIAIIGGAVAGSEAAAVCAERGLWPIVFEQNARPFGKIEDGLPRWHERLRAQEYEVIQRNLSLPGVTFVPNTRLGRDLELAELTEQWGLCGVLLASGAWRDRPLFEGAEAFVGRGLALQNTFVRDYNLTPDDAPVPDALQDSLVVGGGLASIDVVKILRLQATQAHLRARGEALGGPELERDGATAHLQRLGLPASSAPSIRLVYRRQKSDMPLSPLAADATAEQRERAGQIRARIMDKVIAKFGVELCPGLTVQGPLVDGDQLVGLRLLPTGGGAPVELRARRIISAIGSVPEALPGVPMRGELLDVVSVETGELRGLSRVYAIGNAVTGRGNIRDSRQHAGKLTERLVEDTLGSDQAAEDALAPVHDDVRHRVEEVIAHCPPGPGLTDAGRLAIEERVRQHWARVGYPGDLAAWLGAS